MLLLKISKLVHFEQWKLNIAEEEQGNATIDLSSPNLMLLFISKSKMTRYVYSTKGREISFTVDPFSRSYLWIIDVKSDEEVAIVVHESIIVDIHREAVFDVELSGSQEAHNERHIGADETWIKVHHRDLLKFLERTAIASITWQFETLTTKDTC